MNALLPNNPDQHRAQLYGGQNLTPPGPGWDRVKVSENLGSTTAVVTVVPVVTSLYFVCIKMKIIEEGSPDVSWGGVLHVLGKRWSKAMDFLQTLSKKRG